MKEKIIVTNIQRMCMHDGPGIRTTVFLKGCNLHCPWCANPENISLLSEPYDLSNGREGVYGKEYEEDVLLDIILKDKAFWKNGGGITFSGGEPLLQMWKMNEILQYCRREQIHVAIETALQVPSEMLEGCMAYIDLFIIDIKILDACLCSKVLGGNVEQFYTNLELLKKFRKQIIFRIPCCKEYIITEKNCEEILELLKEYSNYPVEIFAIHSLGKNKYESLHKEYSAFAIVSKEELQDLNRKFSAWGNEVSINLI